MKQKIINQNLEKTPFCKSLEKIGDVFYNRFEVKIYGLERVIKLFLLISRFFFPSYFIATFISSRRSRENVMELYVFLKLSFTVCFLYFQLFNSLSIFFLVYLTIETLLYPSVAILCNDLFPEEEGKSAIRKVLFIFIDYIIIIIDFASYYLYTGSICKGDSQITNSVDALYFSVVTSVTIGYGDILTVTQIGKILVICQAIIFLLFGVLFLNFYTSRIKK